MKDIYRKNIGSLLLLMLAVFPVLYLHHQYFDLVEAKSIALRYSLLFCSIAISIYVLLSDTKKEKRNKLNALEISLLLFSLSSLLTTVLSHCFRESFFGTEGWGIGSFAFLMLSCIVIFTSHQKISHVWICRGISIFNIFIFLLVIFDSMGMDLFGLHGNMLNEQRFDYVSTIGNINWLVGYLSLLLPVLISCYIKEKDPLYKSLHFICTSLGLFSLVLCNSDSAFAGIGLVLMVAIPLLIRKNTYYREFSLLLIVLSLELLLISSLPAFHEKLLSYDGFFALAVNNRFLFFILCSLGMTGFIFDPQIKQMNKAWKIGFVLFAELCLAGLAGFFLKDLISSIQTYNYYWGNNRLNLWHTTLFAFKNYLIPEKQWFGIGLEQQADWYGYLNCELNTVFKTTHSEPLQILFTMGYQGMLFYLLVIASFVWTFIKQVKTNGNLCYSLSLIMYFGQSLFNSCNPVNFAVFVIVVSLLNNELHAHSE